MVCQVTWRNHLNTGHPYCSVFRWIWYIGVLYADGNCMLLGTKWLGIKLLLFLYFRLNWHQHRAKLNSLGPWVDFWLAFFTPLIIIAKFYTNNLNTEHLKFKHMDFQTLFCPVFKWSAHMIGPTILKPDVLTINRSVRFSDHHSKTRHLTTGHVWTIWIPDLYHMVTVNGLTDLVWFTQISQNLDCSGGSQKQTSLDFERLKLGWISNGPVFEWSWLPSCFFCHSETWQKHRF